jgi:hypothetical protein
MLRWPTCLVLAAALGGCTDRVVIDDVWDASEPAPDAAPERPAIPDAEADQWPRGRFDAGCSTIQRSVLFWSQEADLIILLDRSSNMQGSFSGSYSKMSALQSALSDTIGVYQSHVRFGFAEFPDPGNKCAHSACCVFDREPPVQPQYNALTAILGALKCSDPQDCLASTPDSPSNFALEAVQRYSSSSSSSRWGQSQYVLLIAAAEPSCGRDDVCPAAVNAATVLGNMDIPVVVLAVGYQPDPNTSCLARISTRGSKDGMPGASGRLYAPTSTTALKENLSTLFGAIARASCTLAADQVPEGAELWVTLGNTTVPQAADCNASSGWCFPPNVAFHNEIMLLGSTCDQYLQMPEASDIRAGYYCDTCSDAGACMPPW